MSDKIPEIDDVTKVDFSKLDKATMWFAIFVMVAVGILVIYHVNRYLNNWVDDNRPYEVVQAVDLDPSRDEIPSGDIKPQEPLSP